MSVRFDFFDKLLFIGVITLQKLLKLPFFNAINKRSVYKLDDVFLKKAKGTDIECFLPIHLVKKILEIGSVLE